MVVMGIIAVLSILGVSAWLSLKSDSIAENAAESVLSSITEAQNKAIAISSDTSATETLQPKVWSIKVNPVTKDLSFVSYKEESGSLVLFSEKSIKSDYIKSLTSISTGVFNGSTCAGGSSVLYVNYSTPFGFYYADQNSNNYIPGGWTPVSPVGNWKLSTPLSSKMCISLAYQGKTRIVVVQQNGDVYVTR